MILNPHDWMLGLIGGLMIGGAASVLLLVNARIMGASGILGSLLEGAGGNAMRERLWFLGGLIAVPALVAAVIGAPATHVSGDLPMLALAGVLVGFGTRAANGCTSGHGVCGMSRFSLRSIVATGVYLAAGMVTFYLARHVMGAI